MIYELSNFQVDERDDMSALVNTTRIGIAHLYSLKRSLASAALQTKPPLSYVVLMLGLLFFVAIVQAQDNRTVAPRRPHGQILQENQTIPIPRFIT